jgi:hypothetical protein
MVNFLETIYSTKLINPRSVSGIISVADYKPDARSFKINTTCQIFEGKP